MLSGLLHQNIKIALYNGKLHDLAILLELTIKSIDDLSNCEKKLLLIILEEYYQLLITTYQKLGHLEIAKRVEEQQPVPSDNKLLLEYQLLQKYLQNKREEFAEAYQLPLKEALKRAQLYNTQISALKEVENLLLAHSQSHHFILPSFNTLSFYQPGLSEEIREFAFKIHGKVAESLLPAEGPTYIESLLNIRGMSNEVMQGIMNKIDDQNLKNIKSSIFYDAASKLYILEFYYSGQNRLNGKRRSDMMAQLTHHLLIENPYTLVSHHYIKTFHATELAVQFGLFKTSKPLTNLPGSANLENQTENELTPIDLKFQILLD